MTWKITFLAGFAASLACAPHYDAFKGAAGPDCGLAVDAPQCLLDGSGGNEASDESPQSAGTDSRLDDSSRPEDGTVGDDEDGRSVDDDYAQYCQPAGEYAVQCFPGDRCANPALRQCEAVASANG